jgi:hypothetical protein
MRIPPNAIIAREKLTQYLLVHQPESDKSKFLAQAGFTLSNPDALETAIRAVIAENDAVLDRTDRFGNFYRVEGLLRGEQGKALFVVTVWMVRTEETDIYRFVTLKPGKKNP